MAYQTYKNQSGKRVPSVTTILSRFKDSGGLLYWANAQGREGKTLDEARKTAATAGTVAHDWVEDYINGRELRTPDASREICDLARAAFDVFLKWKENTKLEVKYTEVALVSEEHQFGGRLDAIGLVGNELVLVDWKTSNSVYADYLYQLAAYGVLWTENYPEHKLVGGYHLLRFAKEQGDFAHHYYGNLDDEAETFLKMRELYDRVKKTEKRAR